MTVTEPGDPFEEYCRDNNFTSEEEISEAFATWILDTTGFDGQQFSLTEDERHWIIRANEVIEWMRTWIMTEHTDALEAAKRCVLNLKPMPGSLSVDD